MTVLSFTTESEATTAQAQIASNMGMPGIGVNAATGLPAPLAAKTTAWATIHKKWEADKWYFLKPADTDMANVTGHTIEETDETWHEPLPEDMISPPSNNEGP
jgi:hypothetical protein